VIELSVPPLKQRQDDILPLVKHFMGEQFIVDKATQQALINHCWSGNVRELENACKRASLLAKSAQLTVDDFGLNTHLVGQMTALASHEPSPSLTPLSAKSQDNAPLINEPDKQQIEAALTEHNGVIARVAKSLGLSRQALYRRMEKYGIRETKS
jgi:DNA-binding NtrC family response regulator